GERGRNAGQFAPSRRIVPDSVGLHIPALRQHAAESRRSAAGEGARGLSPSLLAPEAPRRSRRASPGKHRPGDSFTFAARLLYEQDIPPETILFFPRLIAVLSATALGALLFAVTRNRWGAAAALIALCFYCLSPTVLANTPIVGLDVLGALGAFGAFWVFLRFLTEPTRT